MFLILAVSTIPEEESELLERSLRLQQEQLTLQLKKHKAKLEEQEQARQEILLQEEFGSRKQDGESIRRKRTR